MAFGLGQAIADLFARIVAALQSGGLHNTGGSNTGGGGPSMGNPGGGSTLPGNGQPPAPIEPPVDVPPINIFPSTPPSGEVTQCPVLTPSDYISLLQIQSRAQDAGGVVIAPGGNPIFGGGNMPSAFATGYPVEQTDFFRFRAYGTAGSTTVSFFGRVIRPDGSIFPFNFALTPNSSGTVLTTTPATGQGILVGAAASVPLGTPASGSIFAIGEIGRIQAGVFVPHTLLFNGQLDDKQPLSSTLASPALPTNNPTFKRVTSGGGVAATITLTVTPTPGTRMRFLFIGVQCTCSAVAFSREAVVLIKSGGNTMLNADPNRWLFASESGFLSACIGGQNEAQTSAVVGDNFGLNAVLPESVYFNQAVSVVAGLLTAAAGDIASGLIVNYEES